MNDKYFTPRSINLVMICKFLSIDFKSSLQNSLDLARLAAPPYPA
jgi:hypothetical protein